MCVICQNPSLLAGLPAAALALRAAVGRLRPPRPAARDDAEAWARAAAGMPPAPSRPRRAGASG